MLVENQFLGHSTLNAYCIHECALQATYSDFITSVEEVLIKDRSTKKSLKSNLNTKKY